jgi:hypothetical protein
MLWLVAISATIANHKVLFALIHPRHATSPKAGKKERKETKSEC